MYNFNLHVFIVLLYGIKYSLNYIKLAKGGGIELLPKSPLNSYNI